jgi:uncharacterized protein (TIGR02453 family)
MPRGFPGFPPDTLKFLRALKRNNNREWFQARKSVYENQVKAPMYELVEAINGELASFAPEHVTEPKAAVYRIYRDTRFSKDKTPYKTHVAANFARRGHQKHAAATYYFHIALDEIIVAAGVYMPGPEQLLAIRKHIAAHHEELARILGGKKLRSIAGELHGEQLTRTPKGFPKDHPADELLRHKQWYLHTGWEPDLAETPQLFKELTRYFRAAAPVVDFLNSPLAGKKRDPLTAVPSALTAIPAPRARRAVR